MRINSPEYLNALKDYNIQVNYGYFFDAKPIFKEFIDSLYNLRMQYPKGSPMNLIAKLIMNSLFGRFGMNPIVERQVFCSWEEFNSLADNFSIVDFVDLDEEGYFTTYIDPNSQEDSVNVSVGLASAIAAYGRIFMSKFKNNPDYRLFYSDTDSIFIDKPLPDQLINSELGNFKLEHIFKKAVFLGPKIYSISLVGVLDYMLVWLDLFVKDVIGLLLVLEIEIDFFSVITIIL
jgi:DNA polymerase type B, organellar and viral